MGFLSAAVFQWVNPKSWLARTSAAAIFLDQSRNIPLQAATLTVLFVAVALPCCLVWLAFGAVLQGALRTPRAQRIFNCAMAALLVLSVAALLTYPLHGRRTCQSL